MQRWLILLCVLLLLPAHAFPWGEEEDVGTISGRLLLTDGKPMQNAMVFLFNAATGPAPTLGRYWRVPDVVSAADEEGNFAVTVPVGKYYLSSIVRNSDSGPLGPPRTSDYIYPGYEQSVRDNQKIYRVKKWETVNLGTIRGGVLFDRSRHMYRGPVTAIEGKVTLPDGSPAENAIIFAYDNPAMNGNPRYASDPSGADGKYVLRIGRSGTYYLRLRGIYGGGQPAAGSLMGGGNAGIKIRMGKSVKEVDMIADQFVNPGEQKGNGPPEDGEEQQKNRGAGFNRKEAN